MRHKSARSTWVASLVVSLAVAIARLSGQSLSGDAREVGLGGVDQAAKIFSNESGGDRGMQFVIPLGLLQMLSDQKALRPKSGAFDPSLALEYTAIPAHYVIGRKSSTARTRFIADIREAGLNPDLNSYRGFKPVATLEGGGIMSPTFGHAFNLPSVPGRLKSRLYAGGGPYLTIQAAALFDQRLVNLLGASTAEYVPNSTLEIGNQSRGQAAAQITGGYRGEIALGDAGRGRRIELEANYNQLIGIHYEDIDLNLRLDTNGQGLLRFDSPRGAPLAIDRRQSSRGRGFAVDLAASTVLERWRFSVRADGLGNRIDWTNVRHREYEMARVGGGSSQLRTTVDEGAADVRVTLPVQLRLQGAYREGRWGGIGELQHGLQGTTAAMALERRFTSVELRGGGRLVNRVVLPSAGVSLKAGRHIWFDVGAAVSTANIERQRNVVLASSIRVVFDRRGTPPDVAGNAAIPIPAATR